MAGETVIPGLVMPSYAELFKLAPVDIAVTAREEQSVRPSNIFSADTGDITFTIPGNTEEFIRADSFILSGFLRILNADGTVLVANRRVGIVNSAQSLIHTLTVVLGNQTMSSDPCYAFTVFLANILTYGKDAALSWLSQEIFAKDTPGQMDAHVNFDDAAAGNIGLNTRATYFERSKYVPFRIKLHCGLFSMDKLLPNQLGLTITITRTKAQFFLMAAKLDGANADAPKTQPEYKVELSNLLLSYETYKLYPTLGTNIMKSLDKGNIMYNIVQTTTRPFMIPNGTQSHTIDNVVTGNMPKRITFGFVKSTGYNGDYQRNPFNFEHINLTSLSVYVNGKPYPLNPFKPVYTGNNANWLREYNSLFDATGIKNSNQGLNIHKDEYPHGYCIYSFDLTPNGSASISAPVTPVVQGSLRIDFSLSVALTEPYMCIVNCEFDNIVQVDAAHNVYIDYKQ
jgi:hypothetical protein